MKSNKGIQRLYDRLLFWLILYALSFTIFHIAPVFLNSEFKELLRTSDLIDMFTPIAVVFPFYIVCVFVIQASSETSNSISVPGTIFILLIGTVLFVEGHGMHLSANAIGHYLESTRDSPIFALSYFLDEILGHILWHTGILLLSIGLILAAWKFNPNRVYHIRMAPIVCASLLYGLTYFLVAVEGQTIIFTLPLSFVIPIIIWWQKRKNYIILVRNPVLLFYCFAYILAFILFILWGTLNRGFPQFSDLGWI